MTEPLKIARAGAEDVCLLPGLANRHGLIAGATGTGKTVSLQTMAQAFSRAGVPVFMADVKGDLAGLAAQGEMNPKIRDRLALLGVADFAFSASPVVFWDVWGKSGHPARATISDMGPLLLGRMLNLNDTQQGVLALTFKIADDSGLLLLDMKDLRAMLQHVAENSRDYQTQYGNISAASVGTIQRGLLSLEQGGGEVLFGEPMLDIADLMQTDGEGRGVINILAADKLLNSPKLYSTFLLWLLSELFEHLPEVGDPEKPRLVFFFDEAHLLFSEAPKVLLERIEQVVRLIRSKGVGIYFVTQNPLDVPESILGQLGNRVQHALRAFSPKDQKAVKAAAETMRVNPKFSAEQAITELQVGEALISFLDDKGRPGIVERAMVLPPASRIGPLSDAERQAVIKSSVIYGHYEAAIDRESAYEKLISRASQKVSAQSESPTGQAAGTGGAMGALGSILMGSTGPRGGHQAGMLEALAMSAVRTVGSQIGREVIRGVLGGILGSGRRR